MTEAAQRLLLRLELIEFLDAYVAILDNARLKEWPALFVEDCLYEIIPRRTRTRACRRRSCTATMTSPPMVIRARC